MKGFLRAHPVLSFFALAWLLSWIFMIPLALSRHGVLRPLPGWLHYLSAYGPLAAAAFCAWQTEGSAGLRSWAARLTRWRAGAAWWVLAISPLLAYAAAAVAERFAHGAWPDPRLLGRVNFLPDLGAGALPLWLVNSGLGEEAGWRGYALPTLQRSFTPRRASALIACGWMVWHVPAFLYLPSYEHLNAGVIFGFAFGLLCGAFLLTWLADRAAGSALLPIVWHATFNFTTAPPSSRGLVAATSSTVFTVIGIIACWRLKSGRVSGPAEPPGLP